MLVSSGTETDPSAVLPFTEIFGAGNTSRSSISRRAFFKEESRPSNPPHTVPRDSVAAKSFRIPP